jgi:hypothetical protein
MLIRSAASCALAAERMQRRLARGEEVDDHKVVRMAARQERLLRKLGLLSRRTTEQPPQSTFRLSDETTALLTDDERRALADGRVTELRPEMRRRIAEEAAAARARSDPSSVLSGEALLNIHDDLPAHEREAFRNSWTDRQRRAVGEEMQRRHPPPVLQDRGSLMARQREEARANSERHDSDWYARAEAGLLPVSAPELTAEEMHQRALVEEKKYRAGVLIFGRPT